MKNLLIAAQVFSFVNLLFVPSIAVLLFVAYAVGQTWWFAFIGLIALTTNLVFLLVKPVRKLVWQRLDAIAGKAA